MAPRPSSMNRLMVVSALCWLLDLLGQSAPDRVGQDCLRAFCLTDTAPAEEQ